VGMVIPPQGVDIGHMGLGAARELISMDLEEHLVQHYLPHARRSVAEALPLWGVDHHVPGTPAIDTQVVHHQDVVKVGLHGPGIHHGPGNHAVEHQVAHQDVVKVGLHGPDTHHAPGSRAVETQVALHGPDIHHGPGVALHHGHLVEAVNHVLPHAVELSQVAVRSPVQALQEPPQNSLQGQFSSS